MEKTITLITACLLFLLPAEAQEWAPVGAKWYYTTYNWPGPGQGYTTIEVTGEAIMDGIPVKVLEGSCGCAPPVRYTYEQDGQVFLYVEELDEFRLYYDFNLQAGDTLITFDNALQVEVPVLIESVSTLDIGGTSRKVQHIQYLDDGFHEWGNQIIEGIGSERCLNFIYPACDPVGGNLRCYESLATGVLQFQENTPCTLTPADEAEAAPRPGLLANPAGDYLELSLPGQPEGWLAEIYSLTGQRLYQSPLSAARESLYLGGLPPALYLLQLSRADGRRFTLRFVKN